VRIRITIQRYSAADGTSLVGPAAKVLTTVEGISAIRVEQQYMDRATLSYEWSDAGDGSEVVEQTLWSKGMRVRRATSVARGT